IIESKRDFEIFMSNPESSQPIFHNTELSLDRLPPSVHKTLSNKIENLVEITH
ncbi:hypothetical protein S83_002102, partial [Arachis hypogaea]